MTDRQYKAISRRADSAEIRPGTWIKLIALSAAGLELIPDEFILPAKIKQLDLFKQEKK